MPYNFRKAFVVALALGVVQAFPASRVLAPRAAEPSSSPNLMDGDTTDNAELIAKLKTDATAIKRFQRLLTNPEHQLLSGADLAKATVFDFKRESLPIRGSNGGSTVLATIEDFPILVGSGITMASATLGPCGVFLPHVHPRANEYFLVVEGEVDFGYMPEVGLLKTLVPSPEISGKLTKLEGTLFPQGSVHFQINNSPDCMSASIVATLSSEDPGTTPILQTPSGGNATGEYPDDVRSLVPPQIASMIDACRARCKPARE